MLIHSQPSIIALHSFEHRRVKCRYQFFGQCWLAKRKTTNYWHLCRLCLCAVFFTLAVYGLNAFLTPVLAVLKYIGSIYMVWLAIHIFRSKPLKDKKDGQASFREGFSLQFVNVKIYLYIMTLLLVYLVPHIST
ncbi:LysE family translocator [Desulfitobacterium sp. Sab5]|uniref:LysE family translocator n=1 Tax=Desulfitobacterium nosdiversum TaxID=3375356 RepID=UPI003CEF4533